MWFKRSKPASGHVNPDIGEAQSLRDEAKADLREVNRKDSYVAGLTSRLVERRERNGFGDQIEITYTRRNA